MRKDVILHKISDFIMLLMNKKEQIQLFENRNVRTLWDEQEEEWYFSIVDVVAILTDQQDSKKASTYWSVLKGRLRKEGADEPLTKCKKLKMLSADGKTHPTDAATAETLFRIIQTIPYFEQAIEDYKRLGYSERWINQRIQIIRARKELTDERKDHTSVQRLQRFEERVSA